MEFNSGFKGLREFRRQASQRPSQKSLNQNVLSYYREIQQRVMPVTCRTTSQCCEFCIEHGEPHFEQLFKIK